MPFVKVPGLKGKVFVPQESGGSAKKKPCEDCFSCQQCSDSRCRVCRGQGVCQCDPQLKKKHAGSKDARN